MDIQPVFNEYKTVASVCSYLLKFEDKCSFSMKQVTEEAFGTFKLHQFNTMKNISKPYTSNRKQEGVYHILPELHREKIFPGVQFVNTNLPE